jgi:hypothetical protein
LEVVVPEVATGVEQDGDVAGLWIDSGQVGPLLSVAAGTTQRSILRIVCVRVLRRDDVIEMKAGFVACLGQVTVLTPVSGAVSDELSQGGVGHGSGGEVSNSRR